MESEWSKTVNLYVETEAEFQVNSMKLYTFMVLGYFGRYLDANKGEGWTPADVTNEDVVRFYLERPRRRRDRRGPVFKRDTQVYEIP